MRVRAIPLAIGAALLLIVGGILLLRGSSPQHMSDMHMAQTSKTAVSTNKVVVANFAFRPTTIKVHTGTTVNWTNQDSTEHSVVADTESRTAPKSSLLGQGQSYSFTFTQAGTYTYHCVPHLDMRGTVIVTN